MREALLSVLSDGKRHKIVTLMREVSASVGREVAGSEITREMDKLYREGKITEEGCIKKG